MLFAAGRIRKGDNVFVRIWMGLTSTEKLVHLSQGRRPETITLRQVVEVRAALRACIEPESKELS